MLLPDYLFSENDNSISLYLQDALEKDEIDKYAFILLFDTNTQKKVDDFVIKYGNEINTITGSDIPFFTIYDKETIEKWEGSVKKKQKLLNQDFSLFKQQAQKINFMQRMSRIFEVTEFPTLVFIDVSKKDKCAYRNFSLQGYNSFEIKNSIENIVKSINSSSYGDFDNIINCSLTHIINDESEQEYDEYALINDFDDQYKTCLCDYADYVGLHTIEDIAERLFGMTYRTFRAKISHEEYNTGKNGKVPRSFKRDEIIALSIFLGNDKYGINRYLRVENLEDDFPHGKRELLINDMVNERFNLIEVNNRLVELKLKPLTVMNNIFKRS